MSKDETWWWLCDVCKVQHFGAGSMLFGCEKACKTVKPTTSGRTDPKKLCEHFEPREVDDGKA